MTAGHRQAGCFDPAQQLRARTQAEVLRQVRGAWEKAAAEHAAGPVLGRLFRHSVEVGKRVRSETASSSWLTSML